MLDGQADPRRQRAVVRVCRTADLLKQFGRPEYDKLMTQYPIVAPLFGKDLIAAFRKWDEEIGGAKIKQ